MDTARIIRPLEDAGPWIDKLDDYQSSAELSSAVQATWQAIDRTLRNLLRADAGAPDELRMAAHSATDLPHDRLIPALRQRNLISLQLAGLTHELALAAQRASEGAARASDGDHARLVVQQLRAEIAAASDQPIMSVAHHAVESGVLEAPAHEVPPPRARSNLLRVGALAFTAIGILTFALWLFGGDSDLDKGIAAFQAEQWQQAEQLLRGPAENGDPTARLYLGRVYRSTRQFERAAAVLREAVQDEPNDDDIQRELGKLFLDLGRPQQAIERFKRARELDQKDAANWIWLVQAMRAAGDPNAETILQEAPDEVRATLSRQN